ncbi:hypothetical protein L7F22_048977 [Adiantum nelumboides]|nr:hypothetical protein [Adiantum nelumboides]
MRYVKATVNYGMFYEKNAKLYLYDYTDADWAGDFMDRRSTSGYAFSIGNGMISWSGKKQPTVALSSTEGEYCGAALAACEESWLRILMADFGFDNLDSVTIYCDNSSSIMLAKDQVYHAHTNHIEVHYHVIREKILTGEIDLVYVKINDQVTDITKALGKKNFCYFHGALHKGAWYDLFLLKVVYLIEKERYNPLHLHPFSLARQTKRKGRLFQCDAGLRRGSVLTSKESATWKMETAQFLSSD